MKLTKGQYINLHQWIIRHYGNATKCSFCDGSKAKRFEWALKKGFEYERCISNYIELCPSCHRKYDYTEEMSKKLSILRKGRPNPKCMVPVIRIDNNGSIKNYPSIKHASIETKILRTSIVNCLSNRSSTAGGYFWKYA